MKAFFASLILVLAQPALAAHFLQGNREASVQVVIYGDYECPYTAKLMADMPKWEETYGDKIGVSFEHFPLSFHDNAFTAAIAATCASYQGKFKVYSERIFSQQRALGRAVFVRAAKDLGLKVRDFEKCLTDANVGTRVADGYTAGIALGVTGTPNVFINGEQVKGAYPFEEFKAIIDRHLNEN